MRAHQLMPQCVQVDDDWIPGGIIWLFNFETFLDESRVSNPHSFSTRAPSFSFFVSARRSVSWELMRNSDSRSWANELHSPSEAISRVLRYAIKASYVATGDRWVFVSPVDLAHPHPFHFAQGKKVQSLASFYSRAFSPNNLNYFFSPLSKGGNKSKGNFQ
jgi:hypothetical protein